MTSDVAGIQPAASKPWRANPLFLVSLIFAVLSGAAAVVAIGLVAGVQGPDIPLLLWAAASMIVASLPLILDQSRPPERRHVHLSMISIVYAVQFVLPVFTIWIPAEGPADPSGMSFSNLMPPDIARTQWIGLLGLVSLFAGYALPLGRLASGAIPPPRFEWSQEGALLSAFLLSAFGWFLFAGSRFGLIPSQLGSGFIGGFSDATLFGAALLMATYLRYRSRLALVFLMVLVPASTFFNFFTGSKRLVLTPAAMIVLTWIITQRKVRVRWLALGALAIFLLYPASQFWRLDIMDRRTVGAAEILRNPGPAIAKTVDFVTSSRPGQYISEGVAATGMRLDAVGHAAVIVRDTPAVSPFQNGRTLLLIPIAFVPRILWPDKPAVTIGHWIVETYRVGGDRIDSNIGPSWVGEFYLNFAIPGVILGMAVLGVLLRLAHETLMRPGATIPLVVCAVIVLYNSMLKIQGGVVSAVNGPLISMIPILFVHLALRFFGLTKAQPEIGGRHALRDRRFLETHP